VYMLVGFLLQCISAEFERSPTQLQAYYLHLQGKTVSQKKKQLEEDAKQTSDTTCMVRSVKLSTNKTQPARSHPPTCCMLPRRFLQFWMWIQYIPFCVLLTDYTALCPTVQDFSSHKLHFEYRFLLQQRHISITEINQLLMFRKKKGFSVSQTKH
jgi:hypothetical protein